MGMAVPGRHGQQFEATRVTVEARPKVPRAPAWGAVDPRSPRLVGNPADAYPFGCQRESGRYSAPGASAGGMAEWLKAHAWKACIRETVSWVRIPLPPPPPGERNCKLTFSASLFWSPPRLDNTERCGAHDRSLHFRDGVTIMLTIGNKYRILGSLRNESSDDPYLAAECGRKGQPRPLLWRGRLGPRNDAANRATGRSLRGSRAARDRTAVGACLSS